MSSLGLHALKLSVAAAKVGDEAEDPKGYAVKLPKYSRYAPVLKNSVAMIETLEWRIFLMKDQAAVEEAQRLGAKIVEVDVKF